MPIKTLNRRLRELGRLRLGQKDGNRPVKLDTFRLTSPDPTLIDAAAALYGGTPQPWDTPNGAQHQVVTDRTYFDVQLPTVDSFSQWFERWSGGGCERRCDGETETLTGKPCLCPSDPDDPIRLAQTGQECDFHTRVSVILPELPGIGVWRLDTSGWYAAAELAGVADLLQQARSNGVIIPARLGVTHREHRTPGQPIRRFVVPHIDVTAPLGLVLDSIGAGAAQPHQLAPAAAGALGAGDPAAPRIPGRPPAPAALIQQVAIRCRETGLDDQARHDVAHIVSDGAAASTRGLTRDECDQALAVCDLIVGGHAHLVHDGPYGAPVLLRTDGTPVTFPMSLDKVRKLLADQQPATVKAQP